MGANYDMIIAMGRDRKLSPAVTGFLRSRGLEVVAVLALGRERLEDESVILISPPTDGVSQLVGNNEKLGIPLGEWFNNNPLGIAVSRAGLLCIHLWSLNSGFVAGYSIFEEGAKREADVLFSKHADRKDEIIKGVPKPSRMLGNRLGDLLHDDELDFSSHLDSYQNFEFGLGDIVAKFGLPVHLVEFYEALDEQVGTVLRNGDFCPVSLSGWMLVRYGVPRPCLGSGDHT